MWAGLPEVQVAPGTCDWHLEWGEACGTEPFNLWDPVLALQGDSVRAGELAGVRKHLRHNQAPP